MKWNNDEINFLIKNSNTKTLYELANEFQKNIYFNRQSRYKVDYLINNIIIEIQGDYYHCNPQIYKDGPIDNIQVNNTQKDKLKKYNLSKMGYKVYYIWENDINTNKEKVINFLAALLSNK